MTQQDQIWAAIQRDAKAANLSDGEFLSRNPARYEQFQRARTTPTDAVARDAAADKAISAEAKRLAAAKGISEAEALIAIFSKTAEGRARYEQLRRPKANDGADTGPATGPLSPAELLELSRLARSLGYSATISDLDAAGWELNRALWADLLEEERDYNSHSEDDDDGLVRFTEMGPEVTFANMDWRPE